MSTRRTTRWRYCGSMPMRVCLLLATGRRAAADFDAAVMVGLVTALSIQVKLPWVSVNAVAEIIETGAALRENDTAVDSAYLKRALFAGIRASGASVCAVAVTVCDLGANTTLGSARHTCTTLELKLVEHSMAFTTMEWCVRHPLRSEESSPPEDFCECRVNSKAIRLGCRKTIRHASISILQSRMLFSARIETRKTTSARRKMSILARALVTAHRAIAQRELRSIRGRASQLMQAH